LVFRPYAQVPRAICTSAPLRASTRVSPGFALPRRRSPPFGSRRTGSRGARPVPRTLPLPPRLRGRCVRCAHWVSARALACAPDSLVRVSRRALASPCGRCCGLRPERLVPLQFQALLTFFPKFFSTFPRGTCSLSVSRAYLALDGVYHLLHAAISCSATL